MQSTLLNNTFSYKNTDECLALVLPVHLRETRRVSRDGGNLLWAVLYLNPTNSNWVILNSPLFQIQSHFPGICLSVIYMYLFGIPLFQTVFLFPREFEIAEFNYCIFFDYLTNSCRYESNSGGEREIQRTMLELLNQLDGFDSKGDVKVTFNALLEYTIRENSDRKLWFNPA